LQIAGEVLSDPKVDKRNVDWIEMVVESKDDYAWRTPSATANQHL
jgi:hypothetical protein